MSYSGIKTAFLNFLHKNTQQDPNFVDNNRNDLCASLQHTLVKTIFEKIEAAVAATQIKHVVIGGGVSANSEIRKQLLEKKQPTNGRFTFHLLSTPLITLL